jgi:hypothetical protein
MSIKHNHVPAMLVKLSVTMLKILSLVTPSIKYHMRKIPWYVLVALWHIMLSPWNPRNHATTSVIMILFPPLGSHLRFPFVPTTKQHSMFRLSQHFITKIYKTNRPHITHQHDFNWYRVFTYSFTVILLFFPIAWGEEGEQFLL